MGLGESGLIAAAAPFFAASFLACRHTRRTNYAKYRIFHSQYIITIGAVGDHTAIHVLTIT